MGLIGIPIAILLLLLLGLFGYLGVTTFDRMAKTRRFLATAAPAQAVVVGLPSRLRRVSTGNGGSYPLRVFEPVVRFQTARGEVVEARVEVGTPTPSAAIGQETPILYNPHLPQQVRLAEADGRMSAFWPAFAGCSAVLVLLALLLCLGLMLLSALGGAGG